MEQTVTFEWMTVKRVDPQRLWYLQNGISDHNAPIFVEMLQDLEEMGSGLYTCTLRFTNSQITDVVIIDNNANTRPTGIYKKS
jgi:hypothetical protein